MYLVLSESDSHEHVLIAGGGYHFARAIVESMEEEPLHEIDGSRRGFPITAGQVPGARRRAVSLSIIGDSSQAFQAFVRKWRNWQTRKPQELVAARS
jgi:hypothetical protein